MDVTSFTQTATSASGGRPPAVTPLATPGGDPEDLYSTLDIAEAPSEVTARTGGLTSPPTAPGSDYCNIGRVSTGPYEQLAAQYQNTGDVQPYDQWSVSPAQPDDQWSVSPARPDGRSVGGKRSDHRGVRGEETRNVYANTP